MKLYKDKNWLYQKYSIEKLSQKKIGKICKVQRKTISRWLYKFNIKIRKTSEILKGKEFTKRHKKNISKGLMGRKFTETHRQNLAESISKYFKNRPKKIRFCKKCGIKVDKKIGLLCKQCFNFYMKIWKSKNPDKAKLAMQNSYQKNWQEIRNKQKEYFKNHKEEIMNWKLEYERTRRKIDINFKISAYLRTRLYCSLKNKSQRAGSAVRDLGCSIDFFKHYIGTKFIEGMAWENYGSKWVLDHIIPLCSFNLTNRKQFLNACHYTNIQPLLMRDNLIKSKDDKKMKYVFA